MKESLYNQSINFKIEDIRFLFLSIRPLNDFFCPYLAQWVSVGRIRVRVRIWVFKLNHDHTHWATTEDKKTKKIGQIKSLWNGESWDKVQGKWRERVK